MKIQDFLLIAILSAQFAAPASADIRIRDDYPVAVAINGKVVPSEAAFTPPLAPGEVLVVEAAGKEALRLEVFEGEVTKVSTRLKLAESGEITYRRLRNGVVQEIARISVAIENGEAPSGAASFVAKRSENLRERAIRGSYRMLVHTQNGFGTVLLLQDEGFRVRIVGTNVLSNRFFLGVEGGFSERLTSTFEPITATPSQ